MSSIVEQVGRVVGGRYRLLAPVGAGASSQVFAAVDARLGRRVAVKVLHPMLADDAAFLRRFRAEARLAASLDHPHVMRVFDWGEEQSGPFLVLEFLGGGSLRSLLDTGTRLSQEQVAYIGLEAASGLAYAHRRGIVHRDIKPGNLLFDDEGHLRIADFGVARALAEAALTEPLGAIFGTARYASPEQAEGRPLDDRTDVYSLALVLYEALTGRVPFTSDTVSATLMARVGAILPPARELGPLAPVIAQAAIAEPLARLDANALVVDLDLLCRELPTPRPLPLQRLRLEDYLAAMPDRDPTDVDPKRRQELHQATPSEVALPAPPPTARSTAEPAKDAPPPGAPSREKPPAASAGNQDQPGSSGTPGSSSSSGTPGTVVLPAARPVMEASGTSGDEPAGRRHRARRRRWPKVLAAVVVVLALAAGGAAAFIRFEVYGHSVPHLDDRSLATAEHDVKVAGMRLDVASRRYSLVVPKGEVISQSLRPGALEKSGTVIRVVVSEGPPPVEVPSLKADTAQKARAALVAAHLKVHFAAAQYSETVPSGQVISWTPESGLQPRGTVVTVTMSKGPHPRIIPDVGHGSYAAAASALEALQLVPKEVFETSTTWAKDLVIGTEPAAGQSVPRGKVVDVVVSLGPPLTTVPHVYFGESLASVLAALRANHLAAQVYGPPGATVVLYISDSAGEKVPYGSTVYVYTF